MKQGTIKTEREFLIDRIAKLELENATLIAENESAFADHRVEIKRLQDDKNGLMKTIGERFREVEHLKDERSKHLRFLNVLRSYITRDLSGVSCKDFQDAKAACWIPSSASLDPVADLKAHNECFDDKSRYFATSVKCGMLASEVESLKEKLTEAKACIDAMQKNELREIVALRADLADKETAWAIEEDRYILEADSLANEKARLQLEIDKRNRVISIFRQMANGAENLWDLKDVTVADLAFAVDLGLFPGLGNPADDDFPETLREGATSGERIWL
jgi:hypothetical protein